MIEAPISYTTEDGFLFKHTHSDKVWDYEDIQEKMKAAHQIKLRVMVIPVRLYSQYFQHSYELHYYKSTVLEEEVSK